MDTIQINLPGFDYQYDVVIGNKILVSELNTIFTEHSDSRFYLITNDTVNNIYAGIINNQILNNPSVQLMVLPDGEIYKTQDTINTVYDFLAEKKANRKSILIALGGGVIGDMVGFAAATFMRGIAYVQIPTTLLSQVDSSVGGKTGINHSAGKNFIGAFKQPLRTIIDVDFLNTLSDRQFISGYAELIKHGIIRDAELFNTLTNVHWLDLKSNKELLTEVVFRSCQVKADIVETDEKESYQRALLNFGHTLGHFLETLTNYEQFSHGEAVIIGMDFASWWSHQQGYLPINDYQLIHEHLMSLDVRERIPLVTQDEFQTIIGHDKKSTEEGVRFIGLKAIGEANIFDKMESESLWNSFRLFLETGILSISDN